MLSHHICHRLLVKTQSQVLSTIKGKRLHKDVQWENYQAVSYIWHPFTLCKLYFKKEREKNISMS